MKRAIAVLCAALLASGCPSRSPTAPGPGAGAASAQSPAPVAPTATPAAAQKPPADGFDRVMEKAGNAATKIGNAVPDPLDGVKQK